MIMLIQNESNQLRFKILAVQMLRQFCNNAFTIGDLIGFKAVSYFVHLHFRPLNDKVIVTFKHRTFWDIFRLNRYGIVNFHFLN